MDGAQLAGEANLTDQYHIRRDIFLAIAGGDSRRDAQVDSRLLQRKAADDVGIHVVVSYSQANTFVQDCQEHEEARVVDAVGGAASHAEVQALATPSNFGMARCT